MFQRAMPVLQVHDVERSLAFYVDKLGFSSHGTWGTPPMFAIVQRGQVTPALDQSRDGSAPVTQQYWSAYIYVDDVDGLLAEFAGHEIRPYRNLEETGYGCRDFDVRDPDGHILAFGQVVRPEAMGPGLSEQNTGRDQCGSRQDRR